MRGDATNWLCAQMGAREHYAIPRALARAGVLSGMATDFWAGPVIRSVAGLVPNNSMRALATRYHEELYDAEIISWNARAVGWHRLPMQFERRYGATGRYLGYCEAGRRFASAVVQQLLSRRNASKSDVFFGYDTTSLEIMEHLKERGVICFLDQIDPCQVEVQTVKAEQQAWPGWQESVVEIPDEFYERHEREWAIADRVIVNSAFSQEALIQQGVPAEKLTVVPLCYEPEAELEDVVELRERRATLRVITDFSSESPLRVLFLGQVTLRKGIQYMAQAAECMLGEPVVFDVVGPVAISEQARRSMPANVVFHGRAVRRDVRYWYRRADIFILPTISDGFAITQLEAMAFGLPVIATSNCGEVVSDGSDGYVVPPRDPDAIVQAITSYLKQPDRLASQSDMARHKVSRFSLGCVADNLIRLAQTTRA